MTSQQRREALQRKIFSFLHFFFFYFYCVQFCFDYWVETFCDRQTLEVSTRLKVFCCQPFKCSLYTNIEFTVKFLKASVLSVLFKKCKAFFQVTLIMFRFCWTKFYKKINFNKLDCLFFCFKTNLFVVFNSWNLLF